MTRTREIFDRCFQRQHLETLFWHKIDGRLATGRDGTGLDQFKENLHSEIDLIRRKVYEKSYSFTRYKPKLLARGPDKKPRVVSIPTFRDRLTLIALNEVLLTVFSDLKTIKPHFHVSDIKSHLSSTSPNMSFIRIDVKDYYDSIECDTLLRNIRKRIRIHEITRLIEDAIYTTTVDSSPSRFGVPQGLSISNILAEIYLSDVDQKVRSTLGPAELYRRYVDDILVIAHPGRITPVYRKVKRFLENKQLECHPLDAEKHKTYTKPVVEGVDFVGFHLSRYNTSVRRKSYERVFFNLCAVFTQYKRNGNLQRFIWRLNLKITGCRFNGQRFGWMFFFSSTEDRKQLMRLDRFVSHKFQELGIPLRERRPKKFIRAFHEIRLNLSHTTYIPDFDTFSLTDMKRELNQIKGEPYHVLDTLNDDTIRRRFFDMVRNEVRTLEQDLWEEFS